ncbi:MAG TPA: FAD-linked oxidase C-terminal domain-containing protein [Candidatus Saccharimonadales bacterium]|nr:FAD-linked oxidase C-terminal domain-containing protein [Candidatus Saccharimonadales bacterium]
MPFEAPPPDTSWRERTDRAALTRELQGLVGERWVLHEPPDLMVYEADGLTVETAAPDWVVLPADTRQVAEVVRLCDRQGIPFVPRGAGTGLTGGCVPEAGGVVLSLARMDKVLDVDEVQHTAVVQPGAVNLWVSKAAAPQRLYFAPDPASQQACTVGGNVATNAGGPHCLKYGVTTNHILGVVLVRPDGEILKLGGRTLDAPGYDLVGLVVGSEGTFGVVTEIVVRLLPVPETVRTFLAVFEDIDAASRCVSALIAAGIVPAALEMMDRLTLQAVEPFARAGLPTDAGAALLVELDGPKPGMPQLKERAVEITRAHRPREIREARTEDERALLWKARKSAFGAFGRVSSGLHVMDGVVPRSRIPEALRRIAEISARHRVRCANVFHAGDGNLHPNILYQADDPDEIRRAVEASHEILHMCVELGGTISGEHGIGHEKRDLMQLLYSEADLDLMNRVRLLFNPRNLCNPGKVFPAGRGCGEMRRHYAVEGAWI